MEETNMKKSTFRLPLIVVMAIAIMGIAVPMVAAETTLLVASSAGWIRDIDRDLAAKFTAESGIKIDFQMSPDDQYGNSLKVKFAANEGPDVFLGSSGTGMITYQVDQHGLDLSKEPWVARYVDWAKAGTSMNGKVMMFNTWSVDGWAMLYDPVLFKKAGIAKVPTTFAEFDKACAALLAKGITPIYQCGKAEWYQEVWLNTLAGAAAKGTPNLYGLLNTNKAKVGDQKVLLTGLAQMKTLNDKGYFGKNFLDNTWENSVASMASGKYAMMLVYTTYQNEVLALDPNTKADTWEMFPLPLADNKVFSTSAGGISRAINKDSKNIDAAKKYFNFLCQAENLKAYYAARADLGPISFKDVEGKVTSAYKSCIKNSAGGTNLDFEGGVTFWDSSVIGKLVQELYLGIKTPKQVLDSIDAYRAKMFK